MAGPVPEVGLWGRQCAGRRDRNRQERPGRDCRGKDVLRLLDEIPNKAHGLLGIMVDVNLKTESAGEYLQIVVDPFPNPISYKGEFHYRSGSTRQMLRGAVLNRFLLKKYGRKWDDEPLSGVGLKDLDGRTLEEFRRRAAASEWLARGILDESDAGVTRSCACGRLSI